MLSMTGYAKVKKAKDSQSVEVELKSLNSKGLNLSVIVHPELQRLSLEAHRFLSKKLARGTVKCRIRVTFLDSLPLIRPDMNLAGAVINGLRNISETFGIPDTTTTDTLSRFKDIFVVEIEEEMWESLWDTTKMALEEAVGQLDEERRKEGERLKAHVLKLLDKLQESVDTVERLVEGQEREVKRRLEKRVEELLKDSDIEPDKGVLETEIAFAASKCDVEEEIVRLHSHIARARELADLEEPVGTRLDFLCQEMLRELNTVASKTVIGDVSHAVVEAKWLVSQLREQVQNIL